MLFACDMQYYAQERKWAILKIEITLDLGIPWMPLRFWWNSFFIMWNDTSLSSTHRSYLSNSNLALSNRHDSAMNLRNIGESQVTVGCIFFGH